MTHEVAGLEIVWSFTPLLSTHRCLPPGESGFCRNMRDHSDVGQTFEWLFEVSLCSYWCYSPVFLADIVIQTDLSTLKIKFTKSAGQVDKLLLFLRWGLSTVDERERERLWSPGSEDELDPSMLWEKAHISERSQVCFVSRNEVRCALFWIPYKTWTFTHHHFPFHKVLSGGPLQFPRQPAEWRREA